MATFKHPITGVSLNRIDIHRKALADAETETARILRKEGHKVHDIAAMLGTNSGRVIGAIGQTGKLPTSGA